MLVVVALGGNALLRRDQALEADLQQANVDVAAIAIAKLASEHRVVITHGDGPQIGLLALEAESFHDVRPYPLEVLGAQADGMIGYLLEQALQNALPGRNVGALLTQVTVDAADPAFATPMKPIGPGYEEAVARRLAQERGWNIGPDGANFRRVVASPEPIAIVELAIIRILVDAGVTTICVGGGGIPCVIEAGVRRGVEAVVDKDLSSELLAEGLGADFLLMLTDVANVVRGYGSPSAEAIGNITVAELRSMRFPAGSMGPKVEAACRFVERTGGRAGIGALDDAESIVRGHAGTVVGH